MIRGLSLVVSLLLAGAAPALGQAHPSSHPRGYPHGPGHIPPDSATHAAMHALLHGTWTGMLTSSQGVPSEIDMKVMHDSLRKLTVMMRPGGTTKAGVASDVVVDGDTLQWAQNLSGKSCKVAAVLMPATSSAAESIKGRMACEGVESTFTLHKKTG